MNQTVAAGRGLAAFGAFDSRSTSSLARRKSWLAKTYFNLVSGCNELVDSGLVSTPSVTYTTFTPQFATSFTPSTLTFQSGTTTNQVVCWNTTVAGGSLLRGMNDEPETTSIVNSLNAKVYPNPITGNELTMEVISEFSESAEIILTDISGRLITNEDIELYEGQNNTILDVSGLIQGTYLIRIATASGQMQIIRFVKN